MRRNLANQLKEFIERDENHKNVLLIEGARQVGKSYFINDTLKEYTDRNIIKINLEESPIFREEIDANLDFDNFDFLMQEKWQLNTKNNTILFFDEAQESRNLGSFVRFMKESWSRVSVILTGSSMTRLFDNARFPVGRVEYLRMYPYCFSEFLRALEKEYLLNDSKQQIFECPPAKHQALLNLYDLYLQIGGLPSVVEAYRQNPRDNKYLETRQEIYISQKDDFYRKESGLKHHLFEATIKAVSSNLASPFKLTSITNNHRDAKQALTQLINWHLVLQCEQQSFTPSSEYSPKMYLYDVGLAKSFREGISPNVFLYETNDQFLRNILGSLVENAVYISLLSGKGFLTPPKGWKKNPKNPVEVDFIYKSEGQLLPIEVKAAKKWNKRFASSLHEYLDLAGLKRGVLVSAAPYKVDNIHGHEIINLPFYYCYPQVLENLVSGVKEYQNT